MVKLVIKLKQALKDRSMTQKELEALSGVPQSKISMLCNNNYQELNIANLEKIADAMEIKDISVLMDLVEDNNFES